MKYLIVTLILIAYLIKAGAQEEYYWELSAPILTHGLPGTFDEISVKDPSIVFYENKWHLFYTARSEDEYTTGYVSAESPEKLHSAKRFELKNVRGKTRYGCAPQIFYFEPQQLWYLIFQNRDANYQPVYCTNPDISDPDGWSSYNNLIEKDAEKKWIDFWIIADEKNIYLFYTEGHTGVMVRSTGIHNFPKGWNKSKLVFSNVHEAVHIYKVKNKTEFHMVYELNINGVRSFGLAKARQPEGPWTKVTDTYATGKQLHFTGKKWTEMVSHGEVIRSGYNQLMEYEPEKCRWMLQGIQKKELNKPYTMLPWQLGIIEKKLME